LYYSEISLSHLEIPYESSLCIYLSGCQNHCLNCHYPKLQEADFGDILSRNYINIVDLYRNQATCICFLGEGKNTWKEHQEFKHYVNYAHTIKLKTGLYCGRDTIIEDWMNIFDYIKIGSYIPKFGALYVPSTNQRLYKKSCIGYIDITSYFWNFNAIN